MRSLYRLRGSQDLEKELSLVEDIMYSTIFIYMDLMLLSLIFSYMLFPLHQSIVLSLIIFTGFSAFCIGIYNALTKWKKDGNNS